MSNLENRVRDLLLLFIGVCLILLAADFYGKIQSQKKPIAAAEVVMAREAQTTNRSAIEKPSGLVIREEKASFVMMPSSSNDPVVVHEKAAPKTKQ
jgi:hypothetical protein